MCFGPVDEPHQQSCRGTAPWHRPPRQVCRTPTLRLMAYGGSSTAIIDTSLIGFRWMRSPSGSEYGPRPPVIIPRMESTSEAAGASEAQRRFHFRLVPAFLLRPRRAFANIIHLERSSWLTPLLVLSIAALFPVLATGRVRQQADAFGPGSLPPDFQYYSAEQQAQFTQALESTRSPTFLYVLPAVGSLVVVWLGWLITGGLLHLASTILGGRSTSTAVLNIAAWAGLPFAIRFLVRGIFVLLAGRAIAAPGLAGFIGADASGLLQFVRQLLGLIDVYLLWHLALLAIGLRIWTRRR